MHDNRGENERGFTTITMTEEYVKQGQEGPMDLHLSSRNNCLATENVVPPVVQPTIFQIDRYHLVRSCVRPGIELPKRSMTICWDIEAW
jgi:hypothetical protein